MLRTDLSRGWLKQRFLLALLLVGIGAFANAFGEDDMADSGIRGTVLWGPVKPGPARYGESDEAPLSASFTVMKDDEVVTVFRSDKSGKFEVALPPGDYVLIPDKKTPIPAPQSQTTRVKVPAGGYAELTIQLATGML